MTCGRRDDSTVTGMMTSSTAMPSTSTPGSIARRLATLRTSSDAPDASSSTSATCATTRPLSSRPPRPTIPPVRVVASRERRSLRATETPGANDTPVAAIKATIIAVQDTFQSSTAVSANAPSGSALTRTLNPAAASAAPATPASAPRASDSTTSCWSSRPRPAPRALRTASSVPRVST